ncbi:LysE family translocator [Thalassotalea mangrovi]|uniref:LysE family translocator n=1 Tax=Thalassotalea mangrovi TaxID=2572245 RepID=A0A4U1B7S8_9GAMM|nr:LysE family translocator [Thalassotalea mangrovi]TKB45961.1 LysE family translocator [Thalassotalea mangrovi]
MVTEYLTYATMSALVAALPGPSNFIAAENGAMAGLRKSGVAVTGHLTAVLLLASLSAMGLTSLVLASPTAFMLLKLMGCGYLCYLGINIIRSANAIASGNEPLSRSAKRRHMWRKHFTVAITNPKALLFFSALLPQFVNADRPMAEQFIPLMCISMCSAFTFPMLYAFLGKQSNQFNISNRHKAFIKRLFGLSFIVFALSLVTT